MRISRLSHFLKVREADNALFALHHQQYLFLARSLGLHELLIAQLREQILLFLLTELGKALPVLLHERMKSLEYYLHALFPLLLKLNARFVQAET